MGDDISKQNSQVSKQNEQVRAAQEAAIRALRGSVSSYQEPTEPVADGEWESAG